MNLTYDQAVKIAGQLSYPSKMPCPSWGIDPKHCKTGAKLRKKKNTTCSICYACRGHYCYPKVRLRQQERLEGIAFQYWVDAMIVIIARAACSHFRWLDSGDLQGMDHLLKVILIAVRMPEVQFWLPTQEHKLIADCKQIIPDNLTIRLTNVVIDPIYPIKTNLPVAEVHTGSKEEWDKLLLTSSNDAHYCPADGTGEKKCGTCRACWDKRVTKIIYRRA
jgi:hypothetical protein